MSNINRRILIIDDDVEVRNAYQKILLPDTNKNTKERELMALLDANHTSQIQSTTEFHLDFASQGQIGFEMVKTAIAQQTPFALAFIDMRMPLGWNGTQTATKIRQIDPHIEIVIVTAYSDASISDIVKQVGMPDKLLFLRKPFEGDEILQLALSLTSKWNKLSYRTRELQNSLQQLDEKNHSLQHEIQLRQEKEQALKKSTQQLEASLLELKKAQNKLVEAEKMAALNTLVAGVAHEINTPVGASLTGISYLHTELENIKKAYDNEELEEQDFYKFLDTSMELTASMQHNLQRTADLVKSFKQVAVDQSHDQLRTFNLSDYLHTILLSLKSTTKKRLEITVNTPDKINITGYPGAFSQLITNLIMNTLMHGYPNSDTLGKVDINLSTDHRRVKLYYRDYGKGIPKEHLNKVFEPFFTTKRQSGGTGLGLHILYNIITQQLEGNVQLSSEINQGMQIFIYFPITLKKKTA